MELGVWVSVVAAVFSAIAAWLSLHYSRKSKEYTEKVNRGNVIIDVDPEKRTGDRYSGSLYVQNTGNSLVYIKYIVVSKIVYNPNNQDKEEKLFELSDIQLQKNQTMILGKTNALVKELDHSYLCVFINYKSDISKRNELHYYTYQCTQINEGLALTQILNLDIKNRIISQMKSMLKKIN